MEPFFKDNDKLMFYKYLKNAQNYFEFGSGGSTYQAALQDNISKIYSVESDSYWHNQIKTTLNNHTKIEFLYVEMNTLPNSWGHPGPTSTLEQWKNYSDQILFKADQNIDLILIDGRFRVCCCLKSLLVINDECLIVFDDFLNRDYYHVVLEFVDIVDKTRDNSMVVLKKTSNCDLEKISDLIEKYEKKSV